MRRCYPFDTLTTTQRKPATRWRVPPQYLPSALLAALLCSLPLAPAAGLPPQQRVATAAPQAAPNVNQTLPDSALPDSSYARLRYAKRVLRIPMRDGTRLFAIAYVPKEASVARRFPIVLVRTPFSVGSDADSIVPGTLAPDAIMLRDGYIFVHQEVRGRYRSEGTFENARPDRAARKPGSTVVPTDETTDAIDTIDWLLENIGSHNGRLGIHGVSYGGFYAALAARSGHSAIRAVSLQAPVADLWREDFHHNGAFQLTALWALPIFGTPREEPTAAHWWAGAYARIPQDSMADDYAFLLALGPLRNATHRWLSGDAWWSQLIAHPNYDAFWRARALPERLVAPTAPTLVLGGWFDAENLVGTIAVYRALARAQSAAARKGRLARPPLTLVMGPFGHRQWTQRGIARTMHGDLVFGDSIEHWVQREVEAPFFRVHLKQAGSPPSSGALLFDTGRRTWSRFASWPDAKTRRRRWHLAPNGVLDTIAPTGGHATVEWTSDPASPVPSRCGGPTVEEGSPNLFMSGDQRCVSQRRDVISFTTAPLARDLTIAGEVAATLTFATSRTDADIVVKLVDVYPDTAPAGDSVATRLRGYQQLVRGEVLRGRYRSGTSTPRPFTPDAPTTVRVTLPDVFHTVRAGHRLLVQIQSSWFPLIDRNPQRFLPNIFEASASDFIAARHRVWVGAPRGSAIELPMLR